jgi:hypothetical protein
MQLDKIEIFIINIINNKMHLNKILLINFYPTHKLNCF